MKRILEMERGDGCITIGIYLIPWTVHLKMVKMVNFMLCVLQQQQNESGLTVTQYAFYLSCSVELIDSYFKIQR